MSANRPLRVERLRDDLWEGAPPPSASSTLKSHVTLLRRSLGAGRLVHREGGYLVVLGADDVLDCELFERELQAGRELLLRGEPGGAVAELARALGRFYGPALADVVDTTWGEPEAVRLEELRAATLEHWLDARLALGETHATIADAEAAVAAHPLREGLWAKLVTALYLSGRQAEALRAYQRLRDVLGEELGIGPSRELVELESAVLRQELPAPWEERHGSPVGLAPETPARHVASSLPRELTSFVARPREIDTITSLLERPGLVTLTGAGGAGKTRLALRVAAELEAALEGTWLCELGAVQDSDGVLSELASALGSTGAAGVDPFELVSDRLTVGPTLVVLDNCEHVLKGAASLVARLLGRAPLLRVLATSRAPLGVAGEVVHRVPPMSTPASGATGEELTSCESVRLLLERADLTEGASLEEPEWAAVSSICVRLDGNPLAIELAAARLRTMSLRDVERRLDDRFRLLTSGPRDSPSRQQTLEALVSWSHDLLGPRDRAVLARLSVFIGGFDLPAAEAVAPCAEVEQDDVLDAVTSLVDNSLLQVDASGPTARYRMLETVREYAARRLGDEDTRAAMSQHAAHYLALVEEAAPHLSGPAPLEWRARLDEDDDNLRLAFRTLLETKGASQRALRFGAAVSAFWNARGIYGDDVELLALALARDDAGEASRERGAALAAAGYVMFRRGDGLRALGFLDEALAIAEELGSAALRADALRTMAWLADRRGDHEKAMSFARDAVEAAHESGDLHLLARAYDVRAASSQRAEPEGARRDYREAVRYCRAGGDKLGQATALNNLGVLDLEEGDVAAARRRFAEATELARSVRDAALLPFLEYGSGLAAFLDADLAAAERTFAAAFFAARQTGQRALLGYGLLGLAAVRSRTGRADEGAVLLGASQALFDEVGERPERLEEELATSTMEALAPALGPSFQDKLRDGSVTPLSELFELAAKAL